MSADPLWPQLLLQAALIAVNAFFASAELAVLSLNANVLRKQAEEGDALSKRLLRMVDEPSSFLSTIQIGITLAGFLGSAFAAQNFSDRLVRWVQSLGVTVPAATLNAVAVVLITVILSYFTLVLGELVPKRIAMQKPLAVAKFACGVLGGIRFVMRPVIRLLAASTGLVMRLLGMKNEAGDDPVTEEEIRLMVDIGEEKGAIEPSERDMIENVFEFNNTTVSEVMTHSVDVVAVQEDESDADILEIIRESGLSRFPVYGEDMNDIKGVLNTREFLLNRGSEHPQPLSALIRPAHFVPETLRTDVLFRDMQRKKRHIAVVVDEYGATAGVVTMEDLLEEIVGNIYDEFDPQAEQDIIPLPDGGWRIRGGASLSDIADALDVKFPEDVDFDTLGGLVFSTLSEIPRDGSVMDAEAYDLRIHVEKIVGRRVEWATVAKANDTKEAPHEL